MVAKEKKLKIALEKFRNNQATAWKAARIAEISLSEFLDTLAKKKINLHYGVKELKEDTRGLNQKYVKKLQRIRKEKYTQFDSIEELRKATS